MKEYRVKVNANEFDQMRIPIHQLEPGESVLLKFREFSEQSDVYMKNDLPVGVDPEFVAMFVVLMFDPGSPAREYHNYGKRVTWCFERLGLVPDETGLYKGYIGDAVGLCRSQGVLRRVVSFLTTLHDVDYVEMQHSWIELSKLYEELHQMGFSGDPKVVKTKNEILAMVKKRFKEAEAAVSENHIHYTITMGINEFRAQTSLGIRPEEVVFTSIPMLRMPHEMDVDAFMPDVPID